VEQELDQLRQERDKYKNALAERDKQIALLLEKLRLVQLQRYRASRETTPLTGQEAFVFNEPEQIADEEEQPAPEKISIAGYDRKPRAKASREDRLEGLEVVVIRNELPEDQRQCSCGGTLREMSVQKSNKLVTVPARLYVECTETVSYVCGDCPRQDEPRITIVTPKTAPQPFPQSLASASAVAYVLDQKYTMSIPLYRQEAAFARLGVTLSRQTLANWVLESAFWFNWIYDRMKAHLLRRDVLFADETTVQVLHEEGRSPQTKSYLWQYSGSGRDGPAIVLFEYQKTRAAEHPIAFLRGFHGYLHVDGYAAYERLPGVTLVGCMAHVRRDFLEAHNSLPFDLRKGKPTAASVAIGYCNKLFEIERELQTLSPAERVAMREQKSRPLLEAFRTWLDRESLDALPKSKLGQAIGYTLGQWPKLTAYLQDGRLNISNNFSERNIKPVVIGRKNWLFANTPRGATASATIYSMVITALSNGLVPFSYLTYVLQELPKIVVSQKYVTEMERNPLTSEQMARLDELLPWSSSLPSECRMPASG
jgi:transposase